MTFLIAPELGCPSPTSTILLLNGRMWDLKRRGFVFARFKESVLRDYGKLKMSQGSVSDYKSGDVQSDGLRFKVIIGAKVALPGQPDAVMFMVKLIRKDSAKKNEDIVFAKSSMNNPKEWSIQLIH